MRLRLAMALICAALAGCDSQAERAVKTLLNDPDSAKFSAEVTTPRGNVCGMVNARNRMGGYVGSAPFFYDRQTQSVAIVSPPAERDFRSLWLAIRAQMSFSDELSDLTTRCRSIAHWSEICDSPYPLPSHPLCGAVMDGGVSTYEALKEKFGD